MLFYNFRQNKFLMTLLYNTNGELRLVDLNEPISSQLTLPVGGKIQHIGSQTDLLDLKTGNVGAQVSCCKTQIHNCQYIICEYNNVKCNYSCCMTKTNYHKKIATINEYIFLKQCI